MVPRRRPFRSGARFPSDFRPDSSLATTCGSSSEVSSRPDGPRLACSDPCPRCGGREWRRDRHSIAEHHGGIRTRCLRLRQHRRRSESKPSPGRRDGRTTSEWQAGPQLRPGRLAADLHRASPGPSGRRTRHGRRQAHRCRVGSRSRDKPTWRLRYRPLPARPIGASSQLSRVRASPERSYSGGAGEGVVRALPAGERNEDRGDSALVGSRCPPVE